MVKMGQKMEKIGAKHIGSSGMMYLAEQMVRRYGAKGVKVKWWDDKEVHTFTLTIREKSEKNRSLTRKEYR